MQPAGAEEARPVDQRADALEASQLLVRNAGASQHFQPVCISAHRAHRAIHGAWWKSGPETSVKSVA